MFLSEEEIVEIIESTNIPKEKYAKYLLLVYKMRKWLIEKEAVGISPISESIKDLILAEEAGEVRKAIVSGEAEKNLVEYQNRTLALGDAKLCRMFADLVPGADVVALGDAILKSEDLEILLYFAGNHGNKVDMYKMLDLAEKKGDTYYRDEFKNLIRQIERYNDRDSEKRR